MLVAQVLWNIVLPVLLVVAGGYALQRLLDLDPKPLARATFYLFSPALAFSSLYRMDLHHQGTVKALLFGLLIPFLLGSLGWIWATVNAYPSTLRSATTLVLINSNTGNYGLPLNLFAFGQAGLEIAMLYYIINATLANSVGVYIASSGRASPTAALRNVLQAPLVYATALALAANQLGISVPAPLQKAVDLTGQAAVPVLLVVLGLQLGWLNGRVHWRKVLPVAGLKMLLGPLLAWVLSGWLQMDGLWRGVAVLQASVPTAVMSTVLATEFDCEPEYVAEVVFVTTLLSVVTLTGVVAFVKATLGI